MLGRRATWIDARSGQRMRRCAQCRKAKRVARGFHKGNPSYCKMCRRARAKKSRASLTVEARERMRAADRRWRAKNLEAARAASNRHKAVLKADPVKWAKYLEDHRINHRLRRERGGAVVVGGRAAVMGHQDMPLLPAAPLARLIEGMAERRGVEYSAMAAELGVEPRAAYDWRRGVREYARFNMADQVLVAAQLNWHDVFDDEVVEMVVSA